MFWKSQFLGKTGSVFWVKFSAISFFSTSDWELQHYPATPNRSTEPWGHRDIRNNVMGFPILQEVLSISWGNKTPRTLGCIKIGGFFVVYVFLAAISIILLLSSFFPTFIWAYTTKEVVGFTYEPCALPMVMYLLICGCKGWISENFAF